MADLFDLADLSVYLQQDVEVAAATLARAAATGLLQAETGQHLLLVTDDTVTLTTAGPYVELPQRPVVDVADVAEVAGDAWVLTTFGRLLLTGTGRWPPTVTVTYSHGWDTGDVPDGLRAVALAVAARHLLNPASHQQESTEGYAATYAAAGLQLTDYERRTVRRWRRKTRS